MIIKNTLCVIFLFSITLYAQLTPQDAITHIKRGINIGNTLDPPTEGAWNNGPLQEYYFDDYKAQGFTCIRIPVSWYRHVSNTSPYTIDESWMQRVEQIVDWGLQRNLYIILNAHHESWLKNNYSNSTYKARFDSIWSQIATRFRNKSEKLFFEILNEPIGMTREEVDELNTRELGIIRRTNPTRIIIYSGNDYSGPSQMMDAKIPNDKFLIAYFHAYDPWDFAGLAKQTWGTAQDRYLINSQFETVHQWSVDNNIPVIISEFGAVNKCDYNSRMYFYSSYVEEALANNIPFQVWDDGGDFAIYNRNNRTWNDIKDILIKTYTYGATDLSLKIDGKQVLFTWQNRTTESKGITIQRKTEGENFADFSEVGPETTQFVDTLIQSGKTYYYRIITKFEDKADSYTYPVTIYVNPVKRKPFYSEPLSISGKIEAEDYDIGGEGITYHDTEPENITGAYRNDGVDIEKRTDGGNQISYIATGEWLEYTVDVKQSGKYLVTFYTASMDGGGKLKFNIGSKTSDTLTVPKTNSWEALVPISTTINLDDGVQIMRTSIISAEPFNIDRYEFTLQNPASVESAQNLAELNVYPNPVIQNLNIQLKNMHGEGKAEIFNILGQRVKQVKLNSTSCKINMNGLSSGFYFLRITMNNKVLTVKKILMR